MNHSPLIIKSFTVHVVRIPLRIKVSHHLADRVVAENVLLTARSTSATEGWGESCPREYVTGESVKTVQQVLATQFIPMFLHREFQTFDDVVQSLTQAAYQLKRNQQAAFCALELALLDMAGKHFGQTLAHAIGGPAHTTFRYSGVLAADDLQSVTDQAQRLHQFGFDNIKVKVTRDLRFNQTALQNIREIFGDQTSIRLDANGAWTATEAITQLTALDSFNIDGIEQPVPADDVTGMAQVTAAAIAPVVADESLCSMTDAEGLIAQRGCDIFNIRISKCGGLINSARIARAARDAGLRCQLGAQVGETGFLSAAGRYFASTLRDLVWLEGSFDAYLLAQLVTTPDITLKPGGYAEPITGDGLGVLPLAHAIKATSINQQDYK